MPSPSSLVRLLVAALFVGAAAGALPSPARAQEAPPSAGGDGLQAARYEAGTSVPARDLSGKRVTASIEVTYVGFPAEAQAAFAAAVAIWEQHLTSSVPIEVRAEWAELEPRTLGQAGPTFVEVNEAYLPRRDTWYPIPLAEALAGRNLSGADPDVVATFNSGLDLDDDGETDWYFGLDANPPRGTYDLVTVVLHELGHGLGFLGSFEVDDGEAPAECTGVEDVGCWGGIVATPTFPLVFDRFTEDVDEVSLLNTAVYPNPSLQLGQVLQSDDVFFSSDAVRGLNQDVPIDLYAPSNFEPGSSYSHFDEVTPQEAALGLGNPTLAPGGINSLMTPQLALSEAVHTPGPILCAVFQDMGWPLGAGCADLLNVDALTFDARLMNGDVLLVWTSSRVFDRVEVLASYFGGPFRVIETVEAGAGRYVIDRETLDPGQYTFRLRFVPTAGAEVLGPAEDVFVPLRDAYELTEPYPNPFPVGGVRAARLNLLVREAQDVYAAAYDVTGRRVRVLFDGRAQPEALVTLDLEADGLSAGVYVIHVVGATFSTSDTVVLVR